MEKSEHESCLSSDYKNEERHFIWQFLKQMEMHKGRVTKKVSKEDTTKSFHWIN